MQPASPARPAVAVCHELHDPEPEQAAFEPPPRPEPAPVPVGHAVDGHGLDDARRLAQSSRPRKPSSHRSRPVRTSAARSRKPISRSAPGQATSRRCRGRQRPRSTPVAPAAGRRQNRTIVPRRSATGALEQPVIDAEERRQLGPPVVALVRGGRARPRIARCSAGSRSRTPASPAAIAAGEVGSHRTPTPVSSDDLRHARQVGGHHRDLGRDRFEQFLGVV